MTDKVVNLTYSGVWTAVPTTTFHLHLQSGTLSENDASYMFEINTVVYGGASDASASRDILFVYRSGGVTTSENITNIWYSNVVFLNATISGGQDITITLNGPGEGAIYRSFITAYVKDNVA